MATQISGPDFLLSLTKRHNELLVIFSGHFINPDMRWSTPEIKVHAVIEMVERMHQVLESARGSELFTDHKNLLFLFDSS